MRIKLKKFQLEHANALTNTANDYEVSKFLRNIFPYPYTLEDANTFLNYVTKLTPDKGLEFAIFVDNTFAGAIGITFSTDVYIKTCEIGYWLGRDFWGKGIASKAVEAMIDYTFKKFDVHKIMAEICGDNVASEKVLEKNGFILEGLCKEHLYKNEAYLDMKIYGLCRPK